MEANYSIYVEVVSRQFLDYIVIHLYKIYHTYFLNQFEEAGSMLSMK